MPVLLHCIFIFIVTTLSATIVAAPTINIQSDKASYTVGDTVILVVTLSDSPLIYGGGLDLTFNSAVVNASSVLVNPLWDFTIKEGIIDNTTGDINDIFFTHFSGLSGNLSVATITLTTIASGNAGITIAVSTVKQFTDTGGEIVVFGTNNLASNILVNAAPIEDPEESETEESETEETPTEQTTTEQSTSEETTMDQSNIQQTTPDYSGFIPTNRPSDRKEPSNTTDNDRQDGDPILSNQKISDAFITDTQPDYAKTDSYTNKESPYTPGDSKQSEDSHEEKSFDSTLSTNKNPDLNTGNKKTDDIPASLVILIFLILAMMVYKIIAYNKK